MPLSPSAIDCKPAENISHKTVSQYRYTLQRFLLIFSRFGPREGIWLMHKIVEMSKGECFCKPLGYNKKQEIL